MLTTSQRIATRFALTIAGIVLVLGIIINLAFLGSRWKREQQFIHNATLDADDIRQVKKLKKKLQKNNKTEGGREFGPRNILFVPLGGEEVDLLEENILFGNIVHYEEAWYLYGPSSKPNEIIIVDISSAIENQIDLVRITLIAMLVSSGLGYLISMVVVKRSLRDLHTLAEKVQSIDIDSLQQSRIFPHLPEHDEIQIVSRALQEMTEKMDLQVATIKQFVANVSHEFKTPLMSLQSTIDVAEKVKQYDQLFPKIREQIGMMHRLLDTLTTVMQIQKTTTIKKESLGVTLIISSVLDSIRLLHPEIIFTSSGEKDLQIITHQGMFERILTNLLDNAGKFSPAGGTVTLVATTYSLMITDAGAGISPDQLTQIREPFWQGDAARGTTGFGLGLSLVRQFVTLLDRDIVVKSILGVGTEVKISW